MKKLNKIYTCLIFVFLYMPIAVLIFYSFNASNSTSTFGGFSLYWYKELFNDSATLTALKNTLLLAILSSVIATAIGTIASAGIFKMKNKYVKNGIMAVTNIPMMNPDIVTGISMMLLFVFVGSIVHSSNTLGFGTLLIAHVTFNLPYVILSVYPKFRQMDKHLPEAALDLGCTPTQSFLKVELPNVMSGIVTGLIMAFTLSLDDFVISYFTIGSGFETLPIRIYSMTKKRVTPDMYALSALIFVSILVLLILSNLTSQESKERAQMSKKAKKITKIAVGSTFGVIAAITLIVLIVSGGTETITLNVYNWGEYISDGSEESLNVNAAFEEYYSKKYSEERGRPVKVKVNYTTYASNEDLYAKLKSGANGYDVITPSDYMIERLRDEGLIQPLDLANIPNYKYIKDSFKHPFYDTGTDGKTYSVMYTYGVVGIIYNTEKVDEEDIGGWDLLWNEKYRGQILQFNNPRDAFGTAMYRLGIDVNNATEQEWRAALEELRKQKPVVQSYVMDEIYNKMESGEAWIAAYYAGDCLTMMGNNEALDFYYPQDEDGNYVTNIFADAMCIPTSCSNKKLAEEYIDFMLSEEVAIANAEYIYYGCPNSLVTDSEQYKEDLGEDYDVIYGMIPEEEIPSLFEKYAFRNLEQDKLELENNLWEELKVDSSSFDSSIYVVCGILVAGVVAFSVFKYVQKRKRRKLYWNKEPQKKTA